MQAGGKASDVIADKASQISCWKGLDVLYFADSLGNMDNNEVQRVVKALRGSWKGPLGIHTHNNMAKGLDNTLTAMESGVTWLDATITGMGRGAGNTQTECLLAHIDKDQSKYKPKKIYELAMRYFEVMQKEYGWGSSLLYFLGAQNNVHPTYIQNLLSNSHYETEEVIGAIDYLSSLDGATSYNGAVLDAALSFFDDKTQISGSQDIQGFFDNKNVLIIANGPSTKKYATAIELYIKNTKPTVICVNVSEFIAQEYIDYFAISHNSKFLSQSKRYKSLIKPIILPKCRFTNLELSELYGLKLIDYGLRVMKGVFATEGNYATTPHDITIAYVLCALLESRVSSISVVGFDGYPQDNVLQHEMLEIINFYNTHQNSVEIKSLTPTNYPIKKSSIYAPLK